MSGGQFRTSTDPAKIIHRVGALYSGHEEAELPEMRELPFSDASNHGVVTGVIFGVALVFVGMMLVRRRSEGIWRRFLNGALLLFGVVALVILALATTFLAAGSALNGSALFFLTGLISGFAPSSCAAILLLLVIEAIAEIRRKL